MEYGLIGETLKHSYSKIIHESIENITYDLIQLKENEVEPFIRNKEFKAINVTIPYKEKVIPFLDEMDETAKDIMAVNTIVNRNGILKGYNTDMFGFKEMLRFHGIDVKGKNVMILGTGGTYKTAYYSLKELGVNKIYSISREKKEGFYTYDEAKALSDTEVIVNTTPLGMYPNMEVEPLISLDDYKNLESVVDVIYNPFRTKILIYAKEKGLKACSGLYMLVAQAIKALELFLDKKYDDEIYEKEYYNILLKTTNIVFVGMPASGKSNASFNLSNALGKSRYDTDTEVEQQLHLTVKEIFSKYGEDFFRKMEERKIEELSNKNGIIIATGGGAMMREVNARNLVRNGYVIFLDRPIEDIKSNPKTRLTRPLLTDDKVVDELYKKRYKVYHMYADYEFKNSGTKIDTLNTILEHLKVNK